MGVTYQDDEELKVGEKERSRDKHRFELDPVPLSEPDTYWWVEVRTPTADGLHRVLVSAEVVLIHPHPGRGPVAERGARSLSELGEC